MYHGSPSQSRHTLNSDKTSNIVHKKFPDAVEPKPIKLFQASDFEVVCLIGRGSFGKVNLVRHKTSLELFA